MDVLWILFELFTDININENKNKSMKWDQEWRVNDMGTPTLFRERDGKYYVLCMTPGDLWFVSLVDSVDVNFFWPNDVLVNKGLLKSVANWRRTGSIKDSKTELKV